MRAPNRFTPAGCHPCHPPIKIMVTSRAYRLTSVPTPEQTEKDPANVWLSHEARFRLDAEFVREHALAISGLAAWTNVARAILNLHETITRD